VIQPRELTTRARPAPAGRDRLEIAAAVAAFALLCLAVLCFRPILMEPDDYAYNASIIAITQGHLLTLSTAQVQTLAAHLPAYPGDPRYAGGPGNPGSGIVQWVQLAGGGWISEKDPGYPYLAAPFQLLGIIRLAPLLYGALGCAGLFAGARRWLGSPGGGAAVVLFCCSGAALLFAWRDYMPTFTEASLIAAGTGTLLWAVLAAEASARRRTWAGLAGFAALELVVFVRYTDVVVLGCAIVAVAAARRAATLPAAALAWWLGSVAVLGAGLALFNQVVYGGVLASGYRPGEITFSLSAVLPNFRYLPVHLLEAMPVLVPALAAVAWIIRRQARLRRAGGGQADAGQAATVRRDFAVGLALAATWFSVWALYAAYTWTARPGGTTLQVVRFYVPAIGAMALLAAWLVVRLARRAPASAVTSAVLVVVLIGLGAWSFTSMRDSPPPASGLVHCVQAGPDRKCQLPGPAGREPGGS
jgi:hypothetical protein